jgi:hypothetical protein
LRALQDLCNHNYGKKKIPQKDIFYRNFPWFVLQLSWFKTYPHADAKREKQKYSLIDSNKINTCIGISPWLNQFLMALGGCMESLSMVV